MTEHSDQHFTTISRVSAVGAYLVAFGVGFDRITGHVNRQPWGEERSAFLVVIGVAATVVGAVPLIGWRAAKWLLFAFGCSGIPMIWGQYSRFEARKQAAIRRHRRRI